MVGDALSQIKRDTSDRDFQLMMNSEVCDVRVKTALFLLALKN